MESTFLFKTFHFLSRHSSIVVEGARTKLFFNCVLRKREERVEPAPYQDVLVFYALGDIKMVCVLTPYQDVLVFSAWGDIKPLYSLMHRFFSLLSNSSHSINGNRTIAPG